MGAGIFAVVAAACFPQTGAAGAEPWTIQPLEPGPFPMVRPFRATFRFGWAGIEAAKAEATLVIRGGIARTHVVGATTGLARALYRLDATHESAFRVHDFKPRGFTQIERYKNRTITTRGAYHPEGLRRLRTRTPRGGPAKWRTVRLAPVRDIIPSLFFARSQRLEPGDTISLLAYPGDSPFLVEASVIRRETIQIAGSDRKTLRIAIRLQKILLEKNQPPRLHPHAKFRSGTVWISDDSNRFPLRVEVDIFIGSVFAELESLEFH
jgi:hypothetical protein